MNRIFSAASGAALTLFCGLFLTGAARAQTFTEYSIPVSGVPSAIVAGPGNALWFTTSGYVGRMTTAGAFTTYAVNTTIGCSGGSNGFFVAGAQERFAGIATGADGAVWATANAESHIVRVATDGTVTHYPVVSGCTDLALGEIVAGPDGALWFTERNAAKIGRITTAGQITEYAIPNAAYHITVGADGNLWFSEYSKKAIGRITLSGSVSEFSTGITGPLAAGADGNIWYVSDTIAATGTVGRITPAGVVTETALPFKPDYTATNGIAAGPDGNIWITTTTENFPQGAGSYLITASSVIRVTPTGATTEYAHTTALAGPRQILSLNGVLWFLETGQALLNAGGPTGNKIGTFTVPAYVPPVHIAAVYSTSQSTTQSYLRLYNSSASAGTARLTLSDMTTGATLAQYTTPAIAPGSAPQFGIATIEAAATQSFTKPAYYVVTVELQFAGTVAHVLYRPSDGTLTNLSTCDRGITGPAQKVANVHTKLLATGFPSSIVVYNGGTAATAVNLGIYDARNGNQLGSYVTPAVTPGAAAIVPVTAIESTLAGLPTDLFHYVIKANSSFTGYLQHLVTNQQAGVITDMSIVCAIGN